MTWANTSPVTTGDLITAAQWNQDRLNDEWLARDHWRAEMTRNTNQTITSGVFSPVQFNAVTYDFGGLADTVNDQFHIPAVFPAGITTALMEFKCSITWDANETGWRFVTFRVPGVLSFGFDRRAASGNPFAETSHSATREVQAGDDFSLAVLENSGANRILSGSIAPLRFSIRWVAWQD